MAGVYIIRCKTNNKIYVGATRKSFAERFEMHRRALQNQLPSAPRLLQACHDLYGMESLEFTPIREFPVDEVFRREIEAIQTLRPELNEKVEFTNPVPVDTLPEGFASIEDVAEAAGVTPRAIYLRVARGLQGDALLQGKHRAPRKSYTRKK